MGQVLADAPRRRRCGTGDSDRPAQLRGTMGSGRLPKLVALGVSAQQLRGHEVQCSEKREQANRGGLVSNASVFFTGWRLAPIIRCQPCFPG
jgi:hypothetical protein